MMRRERREDSFIRRRSVKPSDQDTLGSDIGVMIMMSGSRKQHYLGQRNVS